MNKLLTKGQLSVLIVFGVLIIDQIIKILVKTNMFWNCSESYFLPLSASQLWD